MLLQKLERAICAFSLDQSPKLRLVIGSVHDPSGRVAIDDKCGNARRKEKLLPISYITANTTSRVQHDDERISSYKTIVRLSPDFRGRVNFLERVAVIAIWHHDR
jgi:hypothetical protein